MTDKEKAKVYDEAIRKAAALYKASEPMSACNVIIETIFPELKESEDERIRKTLIEYFNEQCDMSNLNGVYGYQVVSWLEKQGEKKPQRMISAEAKEAMYDKPAWSEEDELVIKDIEEAITNYWHGYTQGILLDWLKSLKQRIKGE